MVETSSRQSLSPRRFAGPRLLSGVALILVAGVFDPILALPIMSAGWALLLIERPRRVALGVLATVAGLAIGLTFWSASAIQIGRAFG